jgi:hypothetical protein
MRKRWWVLGAILLASFSFLGIYYIINNLWPDSDQLLAQPQLLLLAFIFLGVGSGTIPFSVFLNQRFSKVGWLDRDKTRLLRQGVWMGAFLVLLAYLQLARIFNITIAVVLAGVFILIETFLLTRE